MAANILVIGSSNTDMIIQVDKIPLPGQTVIGQEFLTFAGGKGANQAVAAQRAGAEVTFFAAVGDDDFGRNSVAGYKKEGMNTDSIQVIEGVSSGVAMIYVEKSGENCIAVAPGANNRLLPEHLESNKELFKRADVVLIQLEIPMATVEAALCLAEEAKTLLILNPAPAAKLSVEALKRIYCITPNETEAEILTGVKVTDTHSASKAAALLLSQGVENVIITLGEKGAFFADSSGSFHIPAAKVKVVDTTAAGDTFNGILATCLATDKNMKKAIKLAVKGASLSVQKAGAINSIPFRESYE